MGVVTDPIADMLTRIRNANTAYHDWVDIPLSRVRVAIAKILKSEGFIREYEIVERHPQGVLRVQLKYGAARRRVITGLRRISRPGLRVYKSCAEIPRVLGGLGLVLISTPQGILSGREARRQGSGGEVLAYVW